MANAKDYVALKVFQILFLITLFATLVQPLIVDLPKIFTYIGMLNCVFFVLGYLLVKVNTNPKYNFIIVLTIGLIALCPLMLISGGVNSQLSFLIPLFPLIAAETGSKKQALFTMMALVIYVFALVIFDSHIGDLSNMGCNDNRSASIGFWLIVTTIMSTYFGIEIQKRNSRYIKKLADLAERDPLTRVLNRRGINNYLQIEIERVDDENPLSILLIDIDHFKKINDEFGHDVGDLCLLALVEQLKENVRQSDYVARMGGEEFMILLPNTNKQQAQKLANKLLDKISSSTIEAINKPMTVTIGVAEHSPKQENDLHALIKHADRALYEGKNQGRNRVVVYRS